MKTQKEREFYPLGRKEFLKNKRNGWFSYESQFQKCMKDCAKNAGIYRFQCEEYTCKKLFGPKPIEPILVR